MSVAHKSDVELSGQELARMRAAVAELGVPFARALAVFIRESTAIPAEAAERTGAQPSPQGSARALLSNEDLEHVVAEHEQLAREGKLEQMEFTADTPAVAVASRLRQMAEAQGVSQKELAARLRMAPSALNRIFKNPDRSKLDTLRRVARALGVPVQEII